MSGPATRPGPPERGAAPKPNASTDAVLVLGGLVAAGGVAAHLLTPPEVKLLLEQLVWRTNAPAALTAVVGGGSLGLLLLVGAGRPVRWLTPEHQDAERARKERWQQLPASVKRRAMLPPLLGFSALGLPHLALWSAGITRFSWPEWLGTEVPVEPWVNTLVELLSGPVGQGWNLLMPAVGVGVLVQLLWSPFRPAWERRLLDGKAFVGNALPSPGSYQHRLGMWRQHPVFLLGAREMPASRRLEPHCELPSWVKYEGKQVFGGLLVFGQKGSGKTSLLQRVIEDTLRYRPHEEAIKPALMALDPKGDLSSFIVRLAGQMGRENDVVRLSVDGQTTWNPFGHLRPDTPARQIRQAGYFLRCAMPRGGGDSAYWEDNATNLLSYSMQLLAYAGEVVSFASLAELVTKLKGAQRQKEDEAEEPMLAAEQDYRQELYERAEQNLASLGQPELMQELQNVRNYFEGEFLHLDLKPRSIVVNTATNFLRKFEGADYRRVFCASSEDPDAFPGFEQLVDEGKIFVLDIRAVEDGQVSASLCCLAKLFCQAAILTRDRRDPDMARVVVNVLDEYQQYVTIGGRGSQGDPEYLETSRSFRAVDVAATQQLSALQDAVGGRDAAQRVAGSFNSVVLFRHNDAALTQYAAHLVGRKEREELSYNVAEGGQNAARHPLMPSAFLANQQSVTRTVQERLVEKDVLTDDLFAGLATFEAVGIFSGEAGRSVVRFCAKPQWVEVRTPQHRVLQRLEEGEPKAPFWKRWMRQRRAS
jgi:hypothetical protein